MDGIYFDLHNAALLLSTLSGVAKLTEMAIDQGQSKAQFNKHIKEFKNALKGRGFDQITEESTALYATNGLTARDALHKLREAKIPCIAFSNDQDNKILVAVPMQFREHADRMLETLSQQASRIDARQFARAHYGQMIVQHVGLSDEQVQLIGQKLMGTGVGYCVLTDKTHSDLIDRPTKAIRVSAENQDIVNRAVMEVRMMAKTDAGRHELERVTDQREALRRALGEARGSEHGVVVADMQRDGTAVVYHITNKEMTRIENGVESHIISTKDPKYEATLGAAILNMQHPMVKACPAKMKNGIYIDDIFTREEIMHSKERLANDDRENGRADGGNALASQIVGLCVSQPGAENASMAQLLNSVGSFSQTCVVTEVAEHNRAGIAELYDRYQKLSLTPDEDEAVLQHAQEAYHEYLDLKADHTIQENDLHIDDVREILDQMMEKDENDRSEERGSFGGFEGFGDNESSLGDSSGSVSSGEPQIGGGFGQ